MKKWMSMIAVLLVVMCGMTACNFTSNMSGLAGGEMQATSKVEEMMAELAKGDVDSALKLMHPTVVLLDAENACNQMSAFLAGRNVTSMEQKSINVNTSAGSSGKTRQENASFRVELDDGTQIYLAVTYLSNNAGEGFVSFQIVLGIV